MREIRLSGSEGGGTEYNPFSLPLSKDRPCTRVPRRPFADVVLPRRPSRLPIGLAHRQVALSRRFLRNFLRAGKNLSLRVSISYRQEMELRGSAARATRRHHRQRRRAQWWFGRLTGKVNCLAPGCHGFRAAFQWEMKCSADEPKSGKVRRGL